ncbi:MAG: TetR/AcrR family transcriptional regulator [Saprospiraceae bacterium]
MGIQERKEREREELREKIIVAATDLFREEHYANISMRKIAQRIEYSVGTLYLYYKDKDELFLAVQDAAFEQAFAYMGRLPHDADPIVRLEQLGERYIRFGLQNPDLYRLMFMMDNPMQALEDQDKLGQWECGIQLHGLLSSLVQECMEAGRLPAGDPVPMSFMLWAQVHGMVSLHVAHRTNIYSVHTELTYGREINIEEMLIEAYHLCVKLIASPR